MERKKRILIGIVMLGMAVIFLSSMGTVVAAEVSQDELKQECKEKFDAQALADNNAWCNPPWVPENDCAYSGCWNEIVKDNWQCTPCYETNMVYVPGYITCVDIAMENFLECIKKANEKQRSIRISNRKNDKGRFEPSFLQWRRDRLAECQKELHPQIRICKESACTAYCIDKGASGGKLAGSSCYGWCECEIGITKEECDKRCREYHGTSKIHGPEAYGKVIDGVCNCYCEKGYEPDETLTCVKVEVGVTKEECDKRCREYHGTSKIHGPEAYGKVIDGVCNCYCKKGYKPDKTLTCVKVEVADPKLRIAKLYTSKTEYDIGDKVKISYIIKNDGTVNVDKYQVGCRIFDSRGEKVYVYVGL